MKSLLEQEQAELQDKLTDGSWFVVIWQLLPKPVNVSSEIDDLLLEKMARWSELDD